MTYQIANVAITQRPYLTTCRNLFTKIQLKYTIHDTCTIPVVINKRTISNVTETQKQFRNYCYSNLYT